MIKRFQRIRNVGRFESFAAPPDTDFARLGLVYGENGRGKTTLGAIFRSLATGDPDLINERRRLGTTPTPHVAIALDGGTTAVFQDGRWSATCADLVVFDDRFVDENVHSGLTVEAGHRQHLHELIIGRQGVALAHRVEELTEQIAGLQSSLRERELQITAEMRHNLSVEAFCALPAVPDTDTALAEARQRAAALRQAQEVGSTPAFQPFALPPIDLDSLSAWLARTLEDVDAAALAAVRNHFRKLGEGGEAWVGEGMERLPAEGLPGECPFCGQGLGASPLLNHYRAYFGQAYASHKAALAEVRSSASVALAGDALARFQRDLDSARQRHRFWTAFLNIPALDLDSTAIANAWAAGRDAILALLDRKLAAPLDVIPLDPESRETFTRYAAIGTSVLEASRALNAHNEAIARLKVESQGGDLAAAEADVQRLLATQSRFTQEGARLCAEYVGAKTEKENAERQKVEVREALDAHRQAVIPRYQSAINELLRRFNADFRIVQVEAVNPRGLPSSTYCIEINEQRVPVTGGAAPAGTPTFRTTLSSGDRNTLALAFFFAWLEQEPGLGSLVVVIDDPITSLDDSRSMVTAQEIRSLVGKTRQTIVLSHSKTLLCSVWQHAAQGQCSAVEVRRSPSGSTIIPWSIHDAAVTEYDRRHALLREFEHGADTDARRVAESLRPLLEGFLRVACPEHYPPGTLLGRFIDRVRESQATATPILSSSRLTELEQINEYARRFHHETNPAWDVAVANINEGELHGFVRRVLAFARRD